MNPLHFVFTLILLATVNVLAAQTIGFSYDAGGNMTQRSLQVLAGAKLSNLTKDSLVTPELNFKIYPNPTNTDLKIEGELPDKISSAKIALLNVNGQVLRQDIYYSGELKSINVSDLKAGMYILELQYSKKKKSSYKIIVTN